LKEYFKIFFNFKAYEIAHERSLKAFDKMVTLYDFEMKEVAPPSEGWFHTFLKRHEIKTPSSDQAPLPKKMFVGELLSKEKHESPSKPKKEKVSLTKKPTKMKVLRKSRETSKKTKK
jgi:hypothetical protein